MSEAIKPESQSEDNYVICPYCRHQIWAEAEDYSESEVKEDCEKCGKTFLRCDNFTVTHHTYPLPTPEDSSVVTAPTPAEGHPPPPSAGQSPP
jgi:ribosomal protein S27E